MSERDVLRREESIVHMTLSSGLYSHPMMSFIRFQASSCQFVIRHGKRFVFAAVTLAAAACGSTVFVTAQDEKEPSCEEVAGQSCYEGMPGTAGVGLCRAGTAACEDEGTTSSVCLEQVTPQAENCMTASDESCDGEGSCTGMTQWVTAVSVGEEQSGLDIAVDDEGNAFVTGYYLGAFDLAPSPLFSELRDAFVLKLGPDGAPKWALAAKGQAYGQSVAVTKDGDVVVAGRFVGSINLGSGTLQCEGSAGDIFVARFTNAGEPISSARFGGWGLESVTEVAVTPDGGVVVVGSFEDASSLGPNFGRQDAFVLALDRDNQRLWSHTFGGEEWDAAGSVAIDSATDILVSGSAMGPVDFGGGSVPGAGNDDAFVLKLSAAGEFRWVRRYGGEGSAVGYAVATDAKDRVYVTGIFSSPTDFGVGTIEPYGGYDTFLILLQPDGEHLWSAHYGGDGSTNHATDLAVDDLGNIVLTGLFSGTVNFGGSELVSNGGASVHDIFVVKLTPDGLHAWSHDFGGPGGKKIAALALDRRGEVYLTGNVAGTLDFGFGETVSVPLTGPRHLFVAHLKP